MEEELLFKTKLFYCCHIHIKKLINKYVLKNLNNVEKAIKKK